MARIEFQIAKHQLTGQPVIKAVVPPGTTRDDISKVHDYILTDVLANIGLEKCPGCLSGIGGITFEEQFKDVLYADLPLQAKF